MPQNYVLFFKYAMWIEIGCKFSTKGILKKYLFRGICLFTKSLSAIATNVQHIGEVAATEHFLAGDKLAISYIFSSGGSAAILPICLLQAVPCHSRSFSFLPIFSKYPILSLMVLLCYSAISQGGGWANALKIALAIFGHEACFLVGTEFYFSEQILLNNLERALAKAR